MKRMNLKVIARDAPRRGDTKTLFQSLDLLERLMPIAGGRVDAFMDFCTESPPSLLSIHITLFLSLTLTLHSYPPPSLSLLTPPHPPPPPLLPFPPPPPSPLPSPPPPPSSASPLLPPSLLLLSPPLSPPLLSPPPPSPPPPLLSPPSSPPPPLPRGTPPARSALTDCAESLGTTYCRVTATETNAANGARRLASWRARKSAGSQARRSGMIATGTQEDFRGVARLMLADLQPGWHCTAAGSRAS